MSGVLDRAVILENYTFFSVFVNNKPTHTLTNTPKTLPYTTLNTLSYMIRLPEREQEKLYLNITHVLDMRSKCKGECAHIFSGRVRAKGKAKSGGSGWLNWNQYPFDYFVYSLSARI